jgi:hypothetical protein
MKQTFYMVAIVNVHIVPEVLLHSLVLSKLAFWRTEFVYWLMNGYSE